VHSFIGKCVIKIFNNNFHWNCYAIISIRFMWHKNYIDPLNINIKTHSRVSRGTRQQGTCKRSEYWQEQQGCRFSHIRSSMMPYPNGTEFTVELASIQGMPHLKFERITLAVHEIWASKIFLILLSFVLLVKNCYNSRTVYMHALIWLKFSTCIGGLPIWFWKALKEL